MEGKVPDFDPLTFEEEFEVCIHSQDDIDNDEDDKEKKASAGVSTNRNRQYVLSHCTAKEFMEKENYLGCFSMNYPVEVFEGIEHPVHYRQISSEKPLIQDALKSTSIASTHINVNHKMTEKSPVPKDIDSLPFPCNYKTSHKALGEILVSDTFHDEEGKYKKACMYDEASCPLFVEHKSSHYVENGFVIKLSFNEGVHDNTNTDNDSQDLHMQEKNLIAQHHSPGVKDEFVNTASFNEHIFESRDIHIKDDTLNAFNTKSTLEAEVNITEMPISEDGDGGGGEATSAAKGKMLKKSEDHHHSQLLEDGNGTKHLAGSNLGLGLGGGEIKEQTKRDKNVAPLRFSPHGVSQRRQPTLSYSVATSSHPALPMPNLRPSTTSTLSSTFANLAPSAKLSGSSPVSLKLSSHAMPPPPSEFSYHSSATTTLSPPAIANLCLSITSPLKPDLAKLYSSATSGPPSPPSSASPNSQDGGLNHYQSPGTNWHVTRRKDSDKESRDYTVLLWHKNSSKKSSDSTFAASMKNLKKSSDAKDSSQWSSDNVGWGHQRHTGTEAMSLSPSGGRKRHIDKNINQSWKKTARRSLDWPPKTCLISEAGVDAPGKALTSQATDVKTARRSVDWPPGIHIASDNSGIWGGGVAKDTFTSLSKEKVAQKSLDWPLIIHTTSEARGIGSFGASAGKGFTRQAKKVDGGPLSWRTASKHSPDWPLALPSTKYFQSSVRAETEFDVKALQETSFSPGFIDTHCHLDFLYERIRHYKSYAWLQKTTKDPFPASYEGCITIFCKPWTFEKITWWEEIIGEPKIWAAFGCHPHFADQFGDEEEVYLQVALLNSKAVALGEIGLDYYKKNLHQFGVQKDVFRRQLRVALAIKKPVIIHCRDAHRDCIDIIKEILPLDYKIHLHCFTGSWEQAEEWLKTFSGLFIGITNLINNKSDPRTQNLQTAVRKIPLHRLLLETDAPYFRPAFLQKTSQHSHPGMALYVAGQVAHLKGEKVQVVLTHARHNTRAMYGV